MLRSLQLFVAIAALAACGTKNFPSLCKDEVPPPMACMTMCDPKPGAPDTCPAGFFCNPDGKCDAECVPGAMPNQCGDGYTCLPNGTCVSTADCTDLACKVVDCKSMSQPATTISGTVYAPNGTLPLYGISVYVPDSDPGPFAAGLSCQKCTDSLPGSPVGKPVVTDEMGNFTLTDMPSGVPVPLVITSGKWRRILTLPTVNQCSDNKVTMSDTTLPKAIDDTTPNTKVPWPMSTTPAISMPKIALTTGGADSLECLIRKLGIADKEISTNQGSGHVNFYTGNGVAAFDSGWAGGGGAIPSATPFWGTEANLDGYDIVILSCEGNQNPNTKQDPALANMKAYADKGGRVFASHWHNIWIGGAWATGGNPAGNAAWLPIAQWQDSPDPGSPDLIDEQNNPKGPNFAQWMLNVGGSTMRDVIPIQGGTDRETAVGINMAMAERWTYTQSTMAPQNFQFTTPIEADANTRCGKVVFSDMHVSGGPGTGDYPTECGSNMMLSPQEKALAFMFFDISSCVGTIF
jgi:hypothetical protein